jgi:hypothetical protein
MKEIYRANSSKSISDIISLDIRQLPFSYEQYGGEGVGTNGGGARIGSFKNYQFKGIGVTPVVGETNNLYNSNGMYPLYEAVVESVCSQVYQHILPLGTVRYHAILDNGVSDHFYTAEEPDKKQMGDMPLAIGVREIARRPAHYLRAGHYKPHPKYRLQVPSDVYRTRKINQSLRTELGGDNAYIQHIGRFLAGCANQFAFAKLFRISHGAVTPSNLSMDGCWLDLTNTTFVPGGDNYYAGNPDMLFLEEPGKIARFVEEMLYTYGKYNEVELNIAPLLQYYFEQFDAYFCHYIPELVGLPANTCAAESTLPARRSMAVWYNQHLRQAMPKGGVPRQEKANDPTVLLIESLLAQIFTSCQDEHQSVPLEPVEAATGLMLHAYQSFQQLPLGHFVTFTAIRALRKLYFAPLFYIGRLYTESRALVEKQSKADIQAFIDAYDTTAAWLFDKKETEEKVMVFESPQMSVHYNMTADRFIVSDRSRDIRELSFVDWREWLEGADLSLLNYDCKAWLTRMADILKTLRENATLCEDRQQVDAKRRSA